MRGSSIPFGVRLVVGIGGFVCFFACGVKSMILVFKLIETVSRRLPEEEQFGDLWWGPEKRGRLIREYRRLYPDGQLLRQTYILNAVMFGCLLVEFWLFGSIK